MPQEQVVFDYSEDDEVFVLPDVDREQSFHQNDLTVEQIDEACKPLNADNKRHAVTLERRRMVFQMAAAGCPRHSIATALGCSYVTLYRKYSIELRNGEAQAERKVAGTVFHMATNPSLGNVALNAAKYWLSARHGWKEDQPFDEIEELKTFQAINDDMTNEEAAAAYEATLNFDGDVGEQIHLIEGKVNK